MTYDGETYKGYAIRPYAQFVVGGYAAVATIAHSARPTDEFLVQPPSNVFQTQEAAIFAAFSWSQYIVVKNLAHYAGGGKQMNARKSEYNVTPTKRFELHAPHNGANPILLMPKSAAPTGH